MALGVRKSERKKKNLVYATCSRLFGHLQLFLESVCLYIHSSRQSLIAAYREVDCHSIPRLNPRKLRLVDFIRIIDFIGFELSWCFSSPVYIIKNSLHLPESTTQGRSVSFHLECNLFSYFDQYASEMGIALWWGLLCQRHGASAERVTSQWTEKS